MAIHYLNKLGSPFRRSGTVSVAGGSGRLNSACPVLAQENHGFTLIELLVAVTIIGILAALAYPSYQQHVIRTNRSEAQQFMLSVANREEQYLLNSRQYGTCCAPTVNPNELNLTVPSRLQQFYTVKAEYDMNVAPPYYIITATPQPGTIQANDNPLTLDSQGAKTHGALTTWK